MEVKNKQEQMSPMEVLINRITEPTEDQLRRYFKKKYRGRFYCQMKEAVTRHLKDKGMLYQDIAEIVYGSRTKHDQVSYNLNNKVTGVHRDVIDNWKYWVEIKKYPISKHVSIERTPENTYEEKMSNSKGYFVENFTTYILT